MIAFTLENVQATFPSGTVVRCYSDAIVDSEPRPLGPPVTISEVDDEGDLTFVGLAEGTAYYAAARIDDQWLLVGFSTKSPDSHQGPTGPAGEDGTAIYSVTGEPPLELGVIGDYAIDTGDGVMWGPKDPVDGWGEPFSLVGPAAQVFLDEPKFVNLSKGEFGAHKSIVLATPAGTAEGDVMVLIAYLGAPSNVFPVAPAGWTLVQRLDVIDEENAQLAVFTKAYDGSPGGINVTWGGVELLSSAMVLTYSGVDEASPVNVSAIGRSAPGGSKTLRAPSVTTTVRDALLLAVGFDNVPQSAVQPAGMVERDDSTGPKAIFHVAEVVQPLPGATGNKDFALAVATLNVGAMLALRPRRLVTSVAGRSGAVTLTIADVVGLQEALDSKKDA